MYLNKYFLSLFLFMIVPANIAKSEPPEHRKQILLSYSAAWCGPCKQMKPLWQDKDIVESLDKNQIELIEIDIDRDRQSGTMWKVSSIPCCILIELDKDGKGIELKRFVGAKPKSFILNWIK